MGGLLEVSGPSEAFDSLYKFVEGDTLGSDNVDWVLEAVLFATEIADDGLIPKFNDEQRSSKECNT